LEKFQTYSNGGGKVALISKDFAEIERVDKSHQHKNQFNAAATYNEQIYLFGGYGFWEMKNITTYYHEKQYEWSIVPYFPESPLPQERSQSWAFWDESGTKMYVLGGRSITDNRDDSYARPVYYKDMWRYDTERNDWKKLYQFQVVNLFSNINGGSFYDVVRCDEHNNFYGFSFKKSQGTTIFNLFAFDETKEQLWFSDPLTDYFLSAMFLGAWIDQKSHTMHVFAKVINDRSDENEVKHYTLDLDQMNPLSKADVNPVALITTPSTSVIPEHIPTGMVLIVLALMAAGIGILRRTGKDEETTMSKIALDITISPTDLPEKDYRVLKFLTDNYENGKWVTALDIEEYAFPEEKNPDYARNLRNIAFSRIQKKLSAKSDFPDNQIIVSRKSQTDKRKLEYKLTLPIRLK
jgi:hypothetical protein